MASLDSIANFDELQRLVSNLLNSNPTIYNTNNPTIEQSNPSIETIRIIPVYEVDLTVQKNDNESLPELETVNSDHTAAITNIDISNNNNNNNYSNIPNAPFMNVVITTPFIPIQNLTKMVNQYDVSRQNPALAICADKLIKNIKRMHSPLIHDDNDEKKIENKIIIWYDKYINGTLLHNDPVYQFYRLFLKQAVAAVGDCYSYLQNEKDKTEFEKKVKKTLHNNLRFTNTSSNQKTYKHQYN